MVFRDVVENIWLQNHVQIYGADDPAELALSNIEDAVDMLDCVARDLWTCV